MSEEYREHWVIIDKPLSALSLILQLQATAQNTRAVIERFDSIEDALQEQAKTWSNDKMIILTSTGIQAAQDVEKIASQGIPTDRVIVYADQLDDASDLDNSQFVSKTDHAFDRIAVIRNIYRQRRS